MRNDYLPVFSKGILHLDVCTTYKNQLMGVGGLGGEGKEGGQGESMANM